MLCPRCSKEIPLGSAVCPFCAQPALSGDPLSATASPTPQPQDAPVVLKVLSVVGGLLCIVTIIVISGVLTRRTRPAMDAQAIGYWIGACIGVFLIPVIGVLLYAKLNKRKHVPAYLFGATCGFALLWSFLGIVPQFAKLQSANSGDLQQHIKQLAKEEIGQAPNSGNQGKYDDILRPLFADIKKFNEEYMAEVNGLDKSAIKPLYGAQTFNGDENISRALQQLRATQAVEEKYASMDVLLQKTKDRLNASSVSEEEKTAFWNSFESSFRKNIEPRGTVNAAEQAWLKDSIGLYEFMKDNEKSFHVRGNKVIFATTDLLNEYNERFEKADAERKEFLAAKEKFAKVQQEGLGRLGLEASDFDVPNHN